MAIRSVVTRGYGNGTFNGTIALVVRRGYASEVAVVSAPNLEQELYVRPEDLAYVRATQEEDILFDGDLVYGRATQEEDILFAWDMVLVRLEAEKLLPEKVSIQTLSRIQDGQGGLSEEWINSYLNVPARFSEISGTESQTASREHLQADYTVTFPYDQNIDETMRIIHQGQPYEVVFVNHARSHDTARRCLVKRV